jgi:isoquinoline 1-oxidoreductase beta subunit
MSPRPDSSRTAPLDLNAYVNLSPGGVVTILTPSAEMGQGTMTALPLILAEELDVDWNDVQIMPSPPAGDEFGDPLFLNMIYSAASRAAQIYFERLRIFGAQARKVLLINAADRLQVPVEELATESSKVIHARSGAELTYAEIAAFATVPEALPEVGAADLKDPADFRLIGTQVPRRDLPAKTIGQAEYSIDVQLPGLVYAAVSRAPVMGAEVVDLDDEAARTMPGVIKVMRGRSEVAVVADSFYRATEARKRIQVKWSRVGAVDDYSSVGGMERNAAAARDVQRTGFPWDADGSIDSAFQPADAVFEREYRTDYMYHACMEPLNAVVWVKDGGSRAEVWAGTQGPWYTVDAVARTVGIDPSKVVLHRTLLGGAFGRRSVHSMDFVTDAAWLSKELERPVKVIWTREDDLGQGHFRPMTAQLLRAVVDDDRRVTAWHHRVACEDPLERFDVPLYEGWGKIPLIVMLGAEHHAHDGTPIPYAYDLPNRLVEQVPVPAGIRVYAMRGVGAMPNRFAIESFVDELAGSANVDPLDFRLQLLHRSPRAQQVLRKVTGMANRDAAGDGRARGLAYSHYGDSLTACVVEISAELDAGRIDVHRVWIAADLGIVIQPDTVRAQLEGGVIFGLSNALYETVTIERGVPRETNFHEYRIMQLPAAPEVSVSLIPSMLPPTGIGEAGTVVAPAALANALAALTGRRLRHLPFTPERVRKLMA